MKGKKRSGILLLSMIVAVLSSCTNEESKTKGSNITSSLKVAGYKVIPEPFDNDVLATANLLPNEHVTLRAPINGTVLDIYFKEGQFIKKGQPIVHLDDRSWKAELVGVKTALDVAKLKLERKEILFKLDGARKEDIDEGKAEVDRLKSQKQQLEVNIRLANIRAPFSGYLGMRDFSVGAFLKEGDVITSLTQLDNIKVDFSLPESYFSSVEVGDTVQVLINKDTTGAVVYALSPQISSDSKTLSVRAKLSLKNKSTVIPGSFAEVLVSTNFIKDALLVPTQAVVPEINEQTVYLYKGGEVVRKNIKLGTRTPGKVHVLEGISAGDTLITTGLMQIREGQRVELQEVK